MNILLDQTSIPLVFACMNYWLEDFLMITSTIGIKSSSWLAWDCFVLMSLIFVSILLQNFEACLYNVLIIMPKKELNLMKWVTLVSLLIIITYVLGKKSIEHSHQESTDFNQISKRLLSLQSQKNYSLPVMNVMSMLVILLWRLKLSRKILALFGDLMYW